MKGLWGSRPALNLTQECSLTNSHIVKSIILTLVGICASAQLAHTQTYVDGHYRRDGAYVPGHYRSNPDGNRNNNWSYRGNYNPYTGRQGTEDPYRFNNW